eukprot:scaffold5772_cov96-Skeletonema_dohrnii-CCMP3373.AAC.1
MGHCFEAVDRDIHSVRYDVVLQNRAGGHPRCLIRSPTTLQRRRYDQQMLEPCKRCFYTIMAHSNGSPEAVERDIHSVRYDMVLESRAGGHLRCLIRSPSTLQRRRYDQQMLEPCKRCFYTIKPNSNGSLEAVDRDIHSVRYDMVLESRAGGHLRCLIRSPTTLQ